MKKNNVFFLLYSFLLFNSAVHFTYSCFVYPTNFLLNENNTIEFTVMYQNFNEKLKNNKLELLFFNPETGQATQGLLSFYNPAGLRVLPSRKAFSFVHDDRVRIKNIAMRSPKSIDFFGPYDITLLEWLTDDIFYFSAKERQSDNLFVATADGDLCRLTYSNQYDYLYPSKIDNKLFYIKKYSDTGFFICATEYPEESILSYFKELNNETDIETAVKTNFFNQNNEYRSNIKEHTEEILFFTEEYSLAFLKMVGPEKGFFLSHPIYIEKSLEYISCTYHMLLKNDEGQWTIKNLFTFDIPLKLLLKRDYKMRLYESILPLLPYYDTEKIYYSHYDQSTDTINIYSYNLITENIEQKTFVSQKGSFCFSPLPYKGTVFCGGLLQNDNKEGPSMKDTEEGISIEFITFPR